MNIESNEFQEKDKEKKNEDTRKINRRVIIDNLKIFLRKKELQRFIKYCLVGINGIGVNILFLYLLTNVFGLFYLISSLIAHEISILVNYLFNNAWTFKGFGENRSFFNKLIRYNIAKISGMMLSIVLLYLYTEFLSLNYLISNVLAIGTGVAWGFFTSIRFVWEMK